MRFMVLVKATAASEAGEPPTSEALAAMDAYMEELVKAGILLDGGGLKPSSAGARVRFSDNKLTVIDGPFAETKELVAGYSILEVGSKEEVIEWVKRSPTTRPGEEWEIEIRPLYGAEDFGDAPTPEQGESGAGLQATAAEQHR